MEKVLTDTYILRYQKYNETQFKIPMEGISARNYDFISSNTGFRKLIVQEWMDKVLGEPPTLAKRQPYSISTPVKSIPFDFIEEASQILHDTLAYGYVFVFPEQKKDGVKFTCLTPDYAQNIEYIYDFQTDRLTFLSYIISTDVYEDGEIKPVNYKHTHQYNVTTKLYRHEVTNLDTDKTTVMDISYREYMVPFLAATPSNKGIWEDADSLIQDIDAAYAEMMLDMQLSRKMILLPENFLEKGARKGLSNTPLLSETSRVFRLYPTGLDAENQKPIVFDGGFNPEPFINTINIIAHEISLKTGFGKGYFSYDKIEGFKTATEITAGRVDMNLAKTRINTILTNIIKVMLTYIYPGTAEDDYVVEVSDSILEDNLTYKNKLFLDVTNGLISLEFYLKESYGVEDISSMLPEGQPDTDDRDYNSEDDIDDEIMQNERKYNPTGANGNIQGKIFNTNLFTKPSN